MDDLASLAIEAIVAARKRAEAAKRQQSPGARPAPGAAVFPPSRPGVRPPASPPGPTPRPAGTIPQPQVAPGMPRGVVAPAPAPAPPLVASLVEPLDSPLLDLPSAGGSLADGRPQRAAAARRSILAIFGSPASLIGGIVVSEVLAPPLSLRPPKTGV